MSWDKAGQLTALTAPDARTFAFEYNADGNLVRETDTARPASGEASLSSSMEYDGAGRVARVNRASGEQVAVTYDAAGRPEATTASDGTATQIGYAPVAGGKGGRPQTFTTAEGSETDLQYNGPLIASTGAQNDAWPGDTTGPQPRVSIGYDATLRANREAVGPDAIGSVDYTYNADEQLTKVGPVGIAYDESNGDPTSLTAGTTTTWMGIDARGDLASLSSTMSGDASVLSESVLRDGLGRITQRSETAGSGPAQTVDYRYDVAGHLTQVLRGGAVAESYGYDVSGGLTSRSNGMLSSWIATDGHGRPTHTADGTSLVWSADGELERVTAPGGAQTTMVYDGFGRLTRVDLPDGRVGRYRYDGLGRRTAVRLDGQLVRRFVYGGAEFPRARVDAAGDVLERYIYASQTHVPDLIVRRDGQRLRLIRDTLGSVRATVDADTGEVLQRISYDAYGQVTADTNPGLQPFGFKGALSDPVAQGAGLVWMGVRAYQPTIARFATQDPAGLAAGWNRHDALAGDPVNFVDVDGRFSSPLHGFVSTIKGIGQGSVDLVGGFVDTVGNYVGSVFCAVSTTCSREDGFSEGGDWARARGGLDVANECSPFFVAGATLGEGAAAGVGGRGRGGGFAGRRGSPIEISPGTNVPGSIGGRAYSGHALDRMQGRGIPPSAVEDAISSGTSIAGRGGTTIHHSSTNGISVVVNRGGRVVTVSHGQLKP